MPASAALTVKSWTTLSGMSGVLTLSSYDFVGIMIQHTTSNSPFSDSTFRINSVSVQAAPEPGTIVLIAAGGLLVILRRRKVRNHK